VTMCILEICMVTSYVITKCKCVDLRSFDISGDATGIDHSTRRGHPTRGTSRWLSPPFSIMLIFRNEFTMKDQLSCYNEYQTIMECLNEHYEGSIIVL
jgi:hypothetical protein